MEPRPGLLSRAGPGCLSRAGPGCGPAFRARPGRPGSTPAQVRTRVVVRRAAGGGARRAAVLARSLWSSEHSMNAKYLDTLVVTEGI